MQAKRASNKASEIVEAFAEGSTCEQILQADRTLTYHDIFHAVSEMPTSQWRRYGGRNGFKKRTLTNLPFRKAMQHRAD